VVVLCCARQEGVRSSYRAARLLRRGERPSRQRRRRFARLRARPTPAQRHFTRSFGVRSRKAAQQAVRSSTARLRRYSEGRRFAARCCSRAHRPPQEMRRYRSRSPRKREDAKRPPPPRACRAQPPPALQASSGNEAEERAHRYAYDEQAGRAETPENTPVSPSRCRAPEQPARSE